jgi:hypothetical protein
MKLKRLLATTMLDELHDARLEFQKLGAGYSPLPPKINFSRCKMLQNLAFFRVTDFEAEANTGSNLVGARL